MGQLVEVGNRVSPDAFPRSLFAAEEVMERFKVAWVRADLKIESSRF